MTDDDIAYIDARINDIRQKIDRIKESMVNTGRKWNELPEAMQAGYEYTELLILHPSTSENNREQFQGMNERMREKMRKRGIEIPPMVLETIHFA